MKKLKVSEIFYSLQGEGMRTGEPTIFIRLQGCKAKHACYASGVKCDTEFESGKEMSVEEITQWIIKNAANCTTITWTGGEPTDQLTEKDIAYFKNLGFYQTIETSGLNPVPAGIDFISLSPKVAEHVLQKNFKDVIVDEMRYVRHKGQDVPQTEIQAKKYYLSPHAHGFELPQENVKHCIDLCLKNPKWSLSLQTHKLLNIL